jgi:hypothetical protein
MESVLVVDVGGSHVKIRVTGEEERLGDNENAFLGGFRIWDPSSPAHVPT